jgi:hypothetical protein
MFADDADIFIDIRHLQGHAIDSVDGVAGVAACFLRPYPGFNPSGFAFARDLDFFAQKAL